MSHIRPTLLFLSIALAAVTCLGQEPPAPEAQEPPAAEPAPAR